MQTSLKPELLYLSQSDVKQVDEDSSNIYIEEVLRALLLHAQKQVVQPLKPYLRPLEENNHIGDRVIIMAAGIYDKEPIVGVKNIGSKHDNPSLRELPRASGLIILIDSQSHYPLAILEASRISEKRTAAVTAIAAQYLAPPGFKNVACIGCGVIAHGQLVTLLEQFPSITTIHLFDLNSEAAQNLAETLHHKFPKINCQIASSAEAAVREGEVVIPCTVTDQPYIHFEWLQKGSFISNVSIMDLHKEVFLKADKVVVDDWEQCNREKKIINQLVLEGRFSREQLHAELGEILLGQRPGRESDEEIIVLNPMGMAIEDIACAQAIYKKAVAAEMGKWLPLY
jgi:ornithine cyclodeaminase